MFSSMRIEVSFQLEPQLDEKLSYTPKGAFAYRLGLLEQWPQF
jgi:hypothetical protein